MRRFYRLVILLIFIASTLLLAARLGGALRGPGPLVQLMTGPTGVPCDQPCLFGILPGVTSIKQAVLMLHAHPLTRDAQWLTTDTLRLAGPDAYVQFSTAPGGLVDSIILTDNIIDTGVAIPGSLADSATLGDVILAFGFSNVGLPGSDYFVLGIPSAGVLAASARPSDFRTHVEVNTPLSMIMVSIYRPCPKEGYNAGVYPWKGFTAISRYINYGKQYPQLSRPSGVNPPPDAACQVLSTPTAP